MMIKGNGVISGVAKGKVIVSDTAFGYFGGVNPRNGEIIDKWHELFGENIKGKVFVYPEGRGSTVGAAIILELARSGCAPAAIVNISSETITSAGCLLADEFYDVKIPMVDSISKEDFQKIKKDMLLEVNGATGEIIIID